MSCKLEPAIWSRGTGQRIACFDRCQLIIARMSNIKEVHGKLKRPSHGKLKLANSCWQTQVGVCERHKNCRQTRWQTIGDK